MTCLPAVAVAFTRPAPLAATVAPHGVTHAAHGPPFAGSATDHDTT